MPAPHPPEFRQRAVELAPPGHYAGPSKIAKDLGISDSCLRTWMHQADADAKGSSGPPGHPPPVPRQWGKRPGPAERVWPPTG
jgi:transposase-like protein